MKKEVRVGYCRYFRRKSQHLDRPDRSRTGKGTGTAPELARGNARATWAAGLMAARRFHSSNCAWGSGDAPRGVVNLSGVNETPLLRGIEVTHAPAQAEERMAGMERKGKLERCEIVNILWTDPCDDPCDYLSAILD